jgi:hypothetical protein
MGMVGSLESIFDGPGIGQSLKIPGIRGGIELLN